MNKVRIIIDSATDLRPDLSERFTVIPLTIHFGDSEYVDGITLNHQDFYRKLISSKENPTTSQATPAVFAAAYEEAVSAGEDVVAITLSSELSGNYQSACIAAADYPGRVYVVDSRNVAIGGGVLAEYALALIEQGLDAKAVAATLTFEKHSVRLIAILDTLEYLKRGGRISRTAAFAGEMLSIKPIISIEDGMVAVIGKARGTKTAYRTFAKEIEASGGIDFNKPVLMGYTGLDETLTSRFYSEVISGMGCSAAIPTALVGSVVGTHAGPGAVALAYFSKY